MANGNSLGAISGGAQLTVGNLARFIPEPKSNLGAAFGTALSTVGALMSKSGSSLAGIEPAYADLINTQIEVQQQMQLVSMYSNIEKSKHETEMAAIRNIRAS